MILRCVRFLVLSAFLLTTKTLAGKVLIDEIMYHPSSEDLRECYVELRNVDTAPADLSGWRFSKGIQFTFPAKTLVPPGGYLVVAADQATFASQHPGVTNYLAGWTGVIGSHVQLKDAQGQVVSELQFSNDGDWATRVLTTNGFAAYGHFGWEWSAAHDGLGSSLELINPALPGDAPGNWGSSTALNGTPGQANSIAQLNTAPLISEVAHAPVIPKSSEVVTISARIADEHPNGVGVTLYYRDASTVVPSSFASVPMLDDGAHNDGLAGDGVFSAALTPQPAGTVIEFYLQARDLEGNVRTYPSFTAPADSPRTANLLYQVDDEVDQGPQPLYRIIMTEMERLELYQLGRGCPGTSPGASMDSDAQMNATWISTDGVVSGGTTTQFRYNVGVRNRGHGTRSSNPNNYHVNIPSDRPWKNQTGINLNSQYAYSQLLGSSVFRRVNIPMAQSWVVQLRINSTNLMSLPALPDNNSFGSYAANEQYNNDFVQRAFALDPGGNSYRGIRDQTLCDPSRNDVADLSWQGAVYSVGAYTNAYFKQNHVLENDWSDLLELIAVLNSSNGFTAARYVSDVQRVLNVDQWMKYMAVNTLLDNTETCLANGVGDDYALYRGTSDPRFVVLPYDLDSVMGRGLTPFPPRHSLFRMTDLPVMDRFMKTPEFAPIYYRWLKELAGATFDPAQMNSLLDQLLSPYVPQDTIDTMKAFNAAQVSYVRSQIPLSLTVSNGLALQSGYARSTVAEVDLAGSANAISTRSVLVDGALATWVAWQGTWSASAVPLRPGLNRILIQSLDGEGAEVEHAYADVWFDNGTTQTVGGVLTINTAWSAEDGPYEVASNLTVASGATLTIAPGTTVYLGAGVNLVVADGGQLVAEGSSIAPIRFSVRPGSGASWGGLTINGSVNSPETRIAYALFEGNGTTAIEVAGGTLRLDHATFASTTHQYVSLDESSFLISGCYFPTTTAPFELLHGTGGIKAGGRGIVRDCFFGSTSGYNDIMDFTGGNRDLNQAIIQFYNNVFVGASDDILDLDGTDAWVEGNIFLHAHKNGAPDSSSAISGGDFDFGAGAGGVRTSQITMIGNLFFDNDQAATAKQGNFFSLINNTIVHTTRTGGLDSASGVVNVRDLDPGPPTTFGAGFYLEGNIIVDAEQLVRNYDESQTTVTLNNNILPSAWNGPGTGNAIRDPLLKHIPDVSETQFTNWADAQVLRDWFSLLAASPAHGTGPNGRDQGGVVPLGASVSGDPVGTNQLTSVTLRVGVARSGGGIPAAGWPDGAGYTFYKWRLDGGPWSSETPTTAPITVNGLLNGPHRVDVIGKTDAGTYQDDPELGQDAIVTSSCTWVVDTNSIPLQVRGVRFNEILALNSRSLTNGGTTPDLIELYNSTSDPVDLVGIGLSDDPKAPFKFSFPPGTPALPPAGYMVVFADSASAAPGIHLGFGLSAAGERIELHDKAANGGRLLDSVAFGLQVRDLSLGRSADGTWHLCRPTFGAANEAVALGDPRGLRINEWLADEMFAGNNDFVELYNPDLAPVALGGLSLSNAEGAPGLNPIAELSFIAGGGYVQFIADANPSQGANHLNFKLSPDVGIIELSDPALRPLDVVNYGPQMTDASEGRRPSGSDTLASFPEPTGGGPNEAPNGGTTSVTNITRVLVNLLSITNRWKYDSAGVDRGTVWIQPGYDDSNWAEGAGLFGYETTPGEYAFPFRTLIPAPDQPGGQITVYYRTHFSWDGSITNVELVSTNYLDDGAVYYLNGQRVGSIRMPAAVTFSTLATSQPSEGTPEVLVLAAAPQLGDNLLAVEVHQVNNTSSDDVFGLELNDVQSVTNIISSSQAGVPVVLNEIFASNHSLTNHGVDTSDWVELFNSSTNTIDLTDLSLSIDPGSPHQFVFAQGTALAAGGYWIVYCDGTVPAATNNTGFSLGAKGGKVFLFNSLANGGGLIDAVRYGLQTSDLSIGRIQNGGGPWSLNVPTPGAANQPAALGSLAGLIVNEWMADPLTGSDWFELYNSGNLPVSLDGLFFTSDLARKTLSPIAPLSFIGSGGHGYMQFQADNNPAAGPDHVQFKLSKAGDIVALFSATGNLITATSFGPQAPGLAQGRLPDGSTNVITFAGAGTPGASNGSNPSDANADGLPDAWQTQYFGSISDPSARPDADPDHDGFNNLQEYQAGTNPLDSGSYLKIDSVELGSGGAVLRFTAVQGKAYRLLYRNDLVLGDWLTQTDLPQQAMSGPVTVRDPDFAGAAARFYRLLVLPVP